MNLQSIITLYFYIKYCIFAVNVYQVTAETQSVTVIVMFISRASAVRLRRCAVTCVIFVSGGQTWYMSDGDGENLSGNLVRHKDHIPVQLPMIQTQHFVEMWFHFPHRDAAQALFFLAPHFTLFSDGCWSRCQVSSSWRARPRNGSQMELCVLPVFVSLQSGCWGINNRTD